MIHISYNVLSDINIFGDWENIGENALTVLGNAGNYLKEAYDDMGGITYWKITFQFQYVEAV
ncbi:MAG: hypothetical protein LBB47_03880 [Spirochaetaceae bacterium]|nr:hypothetical protein [Spirochaetaceae bacterium]